MTNDTNIFHRAAAAFGAVAITMSLLVSYFATPEVQTVTGMLA